MIKRIHATAMQHSFTVVFRWRRRNTKDMQLGDDITKIDMCNYAFRQDLFESLQKEWQIAHAVDAFPTMTNALLSRFFSYLPCPRTAGVDFFRESLEGEDAWLHPPRALIGQTIQRLRICRARGTILVPDTPVAMWYPFVVEGASGTCLFPDSHPTRAGKPMRKRWPLEHGMLSRAGEPMPLEKQGDICRRRSKGFWRSCWTSTKSGRRRRPLHGALQHASWAPLPRRSLHEAR